MHFDRTVKNNEEDIIFVSLKINQSDFIFIALFIQAKCNTVFHTIKAIVSPSTHKAINKKLELRKHFNERNPFK